MLRKVVGKSRNILILITSSLMGLTFFCHTASADDVSFSADGDGVEVRLYYGVNPDDGESYVEPKDQKVVVHYIKSLENTSKTFYVLPDQYLIFERVESGTIRLPFPDNLLIEDLLDGVAEDHKVIHKKASGEILSTLEDVGVTEIKVEALSASYFLIVDDSSQEIETSSETTFEEVGAPQFRITITGGTSFPPTIYHATAELGPEEPLPPDENGEEDNSLDEGKNQTNEGDGNYSDSGWTCALHTPSSKTNMTFPWLAGLFLASMLIFRTKQRRPN